ncbi:MAG: hypothetical protein KC503_34875 [Myxococcales bacterium]|nr:hypothetical protein [Myxococcales bacterium]
MRRLGLSALPLLALLGGACNALLESRRAPGLCGDGVVQSEVGEECDDGAQVGGDGCSATCKREACGNGVVDVGEQCDLGPANDDGGDCTRDCKHAVCGDGHVKLRGTPPYEACDDGNDNNGDGCNPQCTFRGRLTVVGGVASGLGVADGIGQAARFAGLYGLAAKDPYVYMTDLGACAIRRLHSATGQVETVIGGQGLCGLVADGKGKSATVSGNENKLAVVGDTLYFSDRQLLRRASLSKDAFVVTTCLQMPQSEPIRALATHPQDATVLYLATELAVYSLDLSCTCDLFATNNICTPVLLAGSTKGTNDGVGSAAQFFRLAALAVDASRDAMYIADVASLRVLDLTSHQVTTVAGGLSPGHQDGQGAFARFFPMQALALTPSGLYAVEQSSDSTLGLLGWGNVRHIDTNTWQVTTVAGIHGTQLRGQTAESDGFGPFARFVAPLSATTLGGVLYVGQAASLRAMSLSSGQVTTAAGLLVKDFSFYEVRAAAALDGRLYVSSNEGNLREISVRDAAPARTLSLCPTKGNANHIDAITVGGDDVLFVADSGIQGICRVDLGGKVGTPCCSGCTQTCKQVFYAPGGTASDYFRWRPEGIAYDGKYLYLPDRENNRLIRIDPAVDSDRGENATPFDIGPGLKSPRGIAYAAPYLYVASLGGNVIVRVDPTSGATRIVGDGIPATRDGDLVTSSFCGPTSVVAVGTTLFVGESYCGLSNGDLHGHALRQIDLDGDSLHVSTLLGPSSVLGVQEGVGAHAGVSWPAALAYDPLTRALYVADSWANALLKVD